MTVIEQWLMNKICHKEIGEYLKNSYKIQTVAIYGAGKLGEFLYDDLVNNSYIKVEYFIDKNADSLYYGIDDMNIYNLKEASEAKKVDAIIITPYQNFHEIECSLNQFLRFSTIYLSIDDIICAVE